MSDYEVEGGYTTAHVHICSSRSAEDIGRASGMLKACYCSGRASESCCSMARRA
jgi:hypothetical protein